MIGPCGSQPQDTAWFQINSYTIDSVPLPTGVTIDSNDAGLLFIKNTTATPFYILARGNKKEAYPLPITVPNLIPEFRFVNGKAYFWLSLREGWAEQYVSSPNDPYRMDLHPRSHDPSYRELIPSNINRPPDITPPQPQISTLTAIYGTEIITVPIRTTYELNPNYLYTPDPIPCPPAILLLIAQCMPIIIVLAITASILFIARIYIADTNQ